MLWLEAKTVRMHVDAPPINHACQQPQEISTVDAQAGDHGGYTITNEPLRKLSLLGDKID